MSRPPIPDPVLGLLGPRSVTWQLHADPSMWFGGIRSLFLQALHPRVVAGVIQNSNFREDPLGRLIRTATFVGVTTYGTADEANAAAAHVRRIHRTLRATDTATGETFRVDEPELLLWVHCTEVASYLSTAVRAGYPLTRAHADRYLDEQRAAAELVGLHRDDVPGSTEEMAAYFKAMGRELSRTADADTIYEFLHRPPLNGPIRAALPVYEPAVGHLAYSLLPRWATNMYGRTAYPEWLAASALKAFRFATGAIPGGIRIGKEDPHPVQAVARLGKWAAPSPRNLPNLSGALPGT